MKSIKLVTVLILSFLIFGCSDKNIDTQKSSTPERINIHSFTNSFDLKQKSELKLSKQQEKTADQIIMGFEIFLTENAEKDFPKINSYAKKFDWKISQIDEESTYEYNAKLTDGSGVLLKFNSFSLPQNKVYLLNAFNITQKQCLYIVNYFKYNPNIHLSVVEYDGNSQRTNSSSLFDNVINDSFCSGFNNGKENTTKNSSRIKNLSLQMEFGAGSYSKEYINLNAEINKLFDKKYEEVIKQYKTNIYFTKEPTSNKVFRDGVDYAINTIDNSISVGFINGSRCKEIIYYLPEGIQYKINDAKECSNGLNLIKFFK